MRSLIIYVHVYKGINGHLLAKEYVDLFLSLLRHFSGTLSINWFCYGFDKNEETDVEILLSQSVTNILLSNVKFYPSVGSELPTIREIVNKSKIIDPSTLVLYAHSKGASYKDQAFFRNWSIYSVSALAAATDFICERTNTFDEFDAFGSFAGAGVFERYGTMTSAYSGNFWLTTAGFLSRKKVSNAWYSDLHHNRHYAESFIGLNADPSRLFNLEDNYNYYSLKRHDEKAIYDLKKYETQKFFEYDEDLRKTVNFYIDSFYESLITQQTIYSQSRVFWSLRKKCCGNRSFLRRSNKVSKILDRIFPYFNCDLYRHQLGPTHFDIANKLSRTRS